MVIIENIDSNMDFLENVDIDKDIDIWTLLKALLPLLVRELGKILISLKYCIDKDLACWTPVFVSHKNMSI